MSRVVAKIIEVSTVSSEGLEHAVRNGLDKIARAREVGTTPDGGIAEWRVCMRVSFIVDGTRAAPVQRTESALLSTGRT